MPNQDAIRDIVRSRLDKLANRVNEILRMCGDDESTDTAHGAPRSETDLVPIAQAIHDAVLCEGSGDREQLQDVLRGLTAYLEAQGCTPLHIAHEEWDEIAFRCGVRDPSGAGEEEAGKLALTYLAYIGTYRDLLGCRLGTCRQCGRMYLKPLHGADSIYESNACSQRAYRQRKRAEAAG